MMKKDSELQGILTEQAADWLDRLKVDTPSEADCREFAELITRSPDFVEAFLTTSALHTGLAQTLKANPDWLDDELLTVNSPSNIVELQADRKRGATAPVSEKNSWWPGIRAVAASVLILAAGVVGIVQFWPVDQDVYKDITTAFGEQRSVLLDDGSVAVLNTSSEIRVRYGPKERYIELARGEAVFDVAKDPDRPFRVRTGTALINVLGTRFNVYRKPEQTVITVVEGAVVVVPKVFAKGDSKEALESEKVAITLPAGEQMSVYNDRRIEHSKQIDIERTVAWLQRQLVFKQNTIESIANEFNRYNRKRIVIKDEAFKQRRITGVFNAHEPDEFLALLQTIADIQIEKNLGNVSIVYPKYSDN